MSNLIQEIKRQTVLMALAINHNKFKKKGKTFHEQGQEDPSRDMSPMNKRNILSKYQKDSRVHRAGSGKCQSCYKQVNAGYCQAIQMAKFTIRYGLHEDIRYNSNIMKTRPNRTM